MRIITFNTLHCKNFLTQEIDYPLMANVIADSGADVVALNEIYGQGSAPNYIDQTGKLGSLTGMTPYFGQAIGFDGVKPYRLEMQAKLKAGDAKDLYAFWGDSLAQHLFAQTDCIVNLASKEYSVCVSRYLSPEIRFITCVFGEEKDGKVELRRTDIADELLEFKVESAGISVFVFLSASHLEKLLQLSDLFIRDLLADDGNDLCFDGLARYDEVLDVRAVLHLQRKREFKEAERRVV